MSQVETQGRVEFTKDEMRSNAKLYSSHRPIVDAFVKVDPDNREEILSKVAGIVDSLREMANTKSMFADVKRLLMALIKSGHDGQTAADIEGLQECLTALEDQLFRGKGLNMGDMFGSVTAAGVAAIILGDVESDAKIRSRFAEFGG